MEDILNFANLYGHEFAKNTFIKGYKKGKLPHAWLIHGESGIGKTTYVYAIAHFLLDTKEKECCKNLQHHPDCLLIDSKESYLSDTKKTSIISIEKIRQIPKFLSLTSINSKRKIVIINGAEYLNLNAANALLKALEEPVEQSYLFLIANKIGNVPSTLQSRCASLKMNKLCSKDFSRLIKKLKPEISDQEVLELKNFSNRNVNIALALYEQKVLHLFNIIYNVILLYDIELIKKIVDYLNEATENWEILKYIIFYTFHKLITQKCKDSSVIKLIERFEKAVKLIRECEVLHLDKSKLLTAILI